MSAFLVGFGRSDITPAIPTPLAGYGNTSYRLHQSVRDPIFATCLALSDGETTLLWYTQDLIRCDRKRTEKARDYLSERFSLPKEQILLCSTHTHSSVDNSSSHPSLEIWFPFYLDQLAAAAKDALADLSEARLFAGQIETAEMCFVRRYFLKDGTFIGDNSGTVATPENPVVRHESEADRMMRGVRIEREGKKSILLMNFQAHATLTGGSAKTELSADYPGGVRAEVEKRTGAYFAFFQGGAGNMNPTSRMKKTEMFHRDMTAYCTRMADYFGRIMEIAEPVETGKIRVQNLHFSAPVNHTHDGEVEVCRMIRKVWGTNDREGAKALCRQYGYASPYACGAVLTRAGMPEKIDIEFAAVSTGDFAFVTAPYEMFCGSAKDIRERSPFPVTFVCSCSLTHEGYVPTKDAFLHHGYEADMCRFLPGAAEDFADALVGLLEKNKAAEA